MREKIRIRSCYERMERRSDCIWDTTKETIGDSKKRVGGENSVWRTLYSFDRSNWSMLNSNGCADSCYDIDGDRCAEGGAKQQNKRA